MIVILETRCEPEKLRKTIEILGFDGFLATDVHGYAGGIVVGWKNEAMKVDMLQRRFQYMLLRVCFSNGKNWFFSPIYASPNENNRKLMWDELKQIANYMNEA
jgi:hypothetical protein